MVHPRAGLLALSKDLTDISALTLAYFDLKPDANLPEQKVAFGTSGHRGSSFSTSFNESSRLGYLH